MILNRIHTSIKIPEHYSYITQFIPMPRIWQWNNPDIKVFIFDLISFLFVCFFYLGIYSGKYMFSYVLCLNTNKVCIMFVTFKSFKYCSTLKCLLSKCRLTVGLDQPLSTDSLWMTKSVDPNIIVLHNNDDSEHAYIQCFLTKILQICQ